MLRARIAVAACVGAGLLAGCSRSNNLLLGRVEASVAGHVVVVTDCYRTSVPKPEPAPGAPAGTRFTPCRDAEIVIRGDQLTVNGRGYGPLSPGDTVVVDHGVVKIQK